MLTGNREFNEIYEKYKNLVLKAAYIYSGNNYDVAEDITQDTFLKLYTRFDDLKGGNLSAWLFTTAKNAALNYKKKHDREILSVDDEEYTDDEPYRESTEEEYAENELERERARLHDRIFHGGRTAGRYDGGHDVVDCPEMGKRFSVGNHREFHCARG